VRSHTLSTFHAPTINNTTPATVLPIATKRAALQRSSPSAIAIGTALGSLNYLDDDCRGDAGCAAGLALGAAVCAGAGGLIDALIRPSHLIYERAPAAASRLVRPAVESQGWRAAVQFSVRF